MTETNPLRPPGKPNIFGLPRGILGMLAGWMMAWTGAGHNRWAVSRLQVGPGDHVLEIGFGPGVGIALLARQAAHGLVAGIDPSPEMVRQARRRNAAAVRAGRVELRTGTVSALPYGDGRFDRVLSVNNVMLWPDLPAGLREVHRVLRPGGRLVIALHPRWASTPEEVRAMGRTLVDGLTAAGFADAGAEFRADLRPAGAVAVTARRTAQNPAPG